MLFPLRNPRGKNHRLRREDDLENRQYRKDSAAANETYF
jgi:hypothetical protein